MAEKFQKTLAKARKTRYHKHEVKDVVRRNTAPGFRIPGAIIQTREFWYMIFEKVAEILAEQLDVEAEEITPETDIIDDLGADSLDIVDLVMSLEDEFDLEIPDEDVEGIRTVGGLTKYLEDRS